MRTEITSLVFFWELSYMNEWNVLVSLILMTGDKTVCKEKKIITSMKG